MIDAEELLQPISGEKPCGEDLAYDAGFQEIEVIMRGKPETQFSAAEPPDWKALRDRCLELWPRSKDLRLATALSLAALKTDGLPAFREGLALVKGLLERYWDSFYPVLDPADNNDPTQRVNIIAALATPVATFGDPMRLLERLQEAPLADSARMGRFSFADVVRSETGAPGADGQPAPTAGQIEAAFRDTDPDKLQAISRAVADSLQLAQGIDEFLTKTVGADRAPDLDALPNQLREMQKRLAAQGSGAAAPESPAENGSAPAAAGTAAAKPMAGEIQSRQDVIRVLEKICEYYRKHEPSSPVPYMLRRAQRLVAMNFMEILDDMSPDTVKEIQRITGEKPRESE
jgi:type VI secretion system protein ImpA